MSSELKFPLWLFVVATHLNIGDKLPPTMVPLGGCRRIMFLRSIGYISSVLTRNLKMEGKTSSRPMERLIKERLRAELNPTHLSVINESHKHNVPLGSEKHFKIVIVSRKFEDKPLLIRHRMVYEPLRHEIRNDIKAISITAKTPDEWRVDKTVIPTPGCSDYDL